MGEETEVKSTLVLLYTLQMHRNVLYNNYACSMNFPANNQWHMKLNTKDKYLYCPVPKIGRSSWQRLWFYTSGLIPNYNTETEHRNDSDAGVVDVRADKNEMEEVLKSHRYNYSFVFVR